MDLDWLADGQDAGRDGLAWKSDGPARLLGLTGDR